MLGWNVLNGSWVWRVFVITVLAWFLIGSSGCSVTSWDAQASEGKHKTTWNHGLEISVTGWGIYIGPGRSSTTTIENEFEATAQGTGESEGPITESQSAPAPPVTD